MKLEAKNVSFGYSKKNMILENISFAVNEGERVGLVGPSGYGKSTLSKLLAGYEVPDKGEILLDGKPIPKEGYCPVQLIYQHPEKALNPRWKMKDSLCEGYEPDEEILKKIGIEEKWLTRYINELSGGEMQRFCIVRALSRKTKFLICDEISTMLDAVTQAQIWKVLLDIAIDRNLGMVIITHNRKLAERVCTRIVNIDEL